MKKSVKNIIMIIVMVLMGILIFITINNCVIQNKNFNKVDTGYYIIFSISGFIIILTFLYLIMSQFNEFSVRETFDGANKKVIYILELLILLVGLFALQGYFYNKTNNKPNDKVPNNNDGIPITFINDMSVENQQINMNPDIISLEQENNDENQNASDEENSNQDEENNEENNGEQDNNDVDNNEVDNNEESNNTEDSNEENNNNAEDSNEEDNNNVENSNEQENAIRNETYNEDDDEYYDDYQNSKNTVNQETEEDTKITDHKISLSDEKIIVDGKEIGQTGSIYKTTRMDSGTTDQEGKKKNRKVSNIINITKSGNYEFSGSLSDGQIAINANEIQGFVNIILNGVNITCENGPAIFIYSKNTKNESAEISISTAKESYNTINGKNLEIDVTNWENKESILYHIEEANDKGKTYQRCKYDGAISSDISLTFGGEGTLEVTSSKEGIESKMNLTFNGGNYKINSMDDGINASAEKESRISINSGNFVIKVSNEASEGDGIDSNGYVYINGGTVYAFAHSKNDNGIDSELGTYINAGTVLSTGSMYEECKTERNNTIIQMQLKNKVRQGESIVIVDDSNEFVFAFKADRDISNFLYTSENIKQRNYIVYSGSAVSGKLDENNIYLSIQNMDLTKMTKQGEFLMGGAYVAKDEKELRNNIEISRSFVITSTILIAISVFALATIVIIDLNNMNYEEDNNENTWRNL